MSGIIVTRTLAALVAVLTTWLGHVQPVEAVATEPEQQALAYAYDTPHYDQPIDYTASERGPPLADVTPSVSAGHRADGAALVGWPPCPEAAARALTYTYNDCATSALVANGRWAESAARPDPAVTLSVSSSLIGVATKTGSSLVGKSYGLGTVVENPGLAIKGFRGSKTPGHTINRIINRGVSPSMLRNTVANPMVVLRQGSGNYYHLSDEAAVVLRPDGQVVTAYSRADFRQHVLDILADVG